MATKRSRGRRWAMRLLRLLGAVPFGLLTGAFGLSLWESIALLLASGFCWGWWTAMDNLGAGRRWYDDGGKAGADGEHLVPADTEGGHGGDDE